MQSYHAAAWLDHLTARIFFFDREASEVQTLTTTLPHHQLHNKAGTVEGKRNPPDNTFYDEVTAHLEPAREWLILGPGSAHDELAAHIRSCYPQLAGRIVGVATVDHPTDNQIVAHARSFFRAADRMLPLESR
jgi:stalled ribosome rescue protein Dom34